MTQTSIAEEMSILRPRWSRPDTAPEGKSVLVLQKGPSGECYRMASWKKVEGKKVWMTDDRSHIFEEYVAGWFDPKNIQLR